MSPFLTPQQAFEHTPLTLARKAQIDGFRAAVQDVLLGTDKRHLLIVGPCSIHNEKSALLYAELLAELAIEVKETFLIVLRAYLEKPRTQSGWKGFIYDPFLDQTHDVREGILRSRQLLDAFSSLGLPLATEFLDPHIAPYIQDFISWGSIGARTAESPIHRALAAGLEMPVGFKNRPDGSIDVAISACLSAKQPHSTLTIGPHGNLILHNVPGNCMPHIVLRGGSSGPNYDLQSQEAACEKLQRAQLTQSILVDCSHDNCKKNHRLQEPVFSALIEQIAHTDSPIRGIMLESFLHESRQSMNGPISDTVSITDPCLDWQSTKKLILWAHSMLADRALHTYSRTCI